MIGLGTIINTGAIVVGGILGKFFGRFLKQRHQDTVIKTCGVSTMFISIAGAMEKMLTVEGGGLVSGQALLLVLCLVLGALVGEIINIEGLFERFGEWLKVKTGNARDGGFVDAFVTTSLTVCIGAMAIIGSIQDGIFGDYTILATKAVLDFVLVLMLAGSMGNGCIFSAIPVFLLQGGMTLLARVIEPVMTEAALANLSMVGSVLIFCVGINLVFDKRVRVANLLPALVFAAAAAFLPFSLG